MHLRIEETGAYEVGPDSLRGQLCGNTRGQPDQSVFRSGVRGAGGKAEKRIYGSNVTIAPPRPPASLADSCCMLYAEKGAFEVDVENPVPFLRCQIRDSGELPLNARVVWRRTRMPR